VVVLIVCLLVCFVVWRRSKRPKKEDLEDNPISTEDPETTDLERQLQEHYRSLKKEEEEERLEEEQRRRKEKEEEEDKRLKAEQESEEDAVEEEQDKRLKAEQETKEDLVEEEKEEEEEEEEEKEEDEEEKEEKDNKDQEERAEKDGKQHEEKDWQALCPSGHALTEMVRQQTPYMCDVCHQRIPPGTKLHGCRECNYDTCSKCLESQKEGKDEEDEKLGIGDDDLQAAVEVMLAEFVVLPEDDDAPEGLPSSCKAEVSLFMGASDHACSPRSLEVKSNGTKATEDDSPGVEFQTRALEKSDGTGGTDDSRRVEFRELLDSKMDRELTQSRVEFREATVESDIHVAPLKTSCRLPGGLALETTCTLRKGRGGDCTYPACPPRKSPLISL